MKESRSGADYLEEVYDALSAVWDKSKFNLKKGYDDEYDCDCVVITLREDPKFISKTYVIEDGDANFVAGRPTAFQTVWHYPGDHGVGVGETLEFQSTDLDDFAVEAFDYFDELKQRAAKSFESKKGTEMKSEANKEDLKNKVVSDGTHDTKELVAKFLDVLEEYANETYLSYMDENPELVDDWDHLDDETLGWVLDELFDKLNEIAPEGYYFGASEGDGACFGFWSAEQDESKKKGAKSKKEDFNPSAEFYLAKGAIEDWLDRNKVVSYDYDGATVDTYHGAQPKGDWTVTWDAEDGEHTAVVHAGSFETKFNSFNDRIDLSLVKDGGKPMWYTSASDVLYALEEYINATLKGKTEAKKSEGLPFGKRFTDAAGHTIELSDWRIKDDDLGYFCGYDKGGEPIFDQDKSKAVVFPFDQENYPNDEVSKELDRLGKMGYTHTRKLQKATRVEAQKSEAYEDIWRGADVMTHDEACDQLDYVKEIEDDIISEYGEDYYEDPDAVDEYSQRLHDYIDSCFDQDFVSINGEEIPLGISRDPKLLIVLTDDTKHGDEAVELVKKLANGELTGSSDDGDYVAIMDGVHGSPHFDIYSEEPKSEGKSDKDGKDDKDCKGKGCDGSDEKCGGDKKGSRFCKMSEGNATDYDGKYYVDIEDEDEDALYSSDMEFDNARKASMWAFDELKKNKDDDVFQASVYQLFVNDDGDLDHELVEVIHKSDLDESKQTEGIRKEKKWMLILPSKASVEEQSAVLRDKGIPFHVTGRTIFIKPSDSYDETIERLYGPLAELTDVDVVEAKQSEKCVSERAIPGGKAFLQKMSDAGLQDVLDKMSSKGITFELTNTDGPIYAPGYARWNGYEDKRFVGNLYQCKRSQKSGDWEGPIFLGWDKKLDIPYVYASGAKIEGMYGSRNPFEQFMRDLDTDLRESLKNEDSLADMEIQVRKPGEPWCRWTVTWPEFVKMHKQDAIDRGYPEVRVLKLKPNSNIGVVVDGPEESKQTERRLNPVSVDAITKDDFDAYVAVQRSGKYNMIMDADAAADDADLDIDTYYGIIKNYGALVSKYGRKGESLSESLTLKQKELKDMARFGQAEDITTISDEEAKALRKKGIETIGVSRGTYGMNGALLRDNEGKKYVITSRSSNLFYFV